ncbi:carnitine transporter [Staphylotrichum longicolle]|uniref:SWR1-complex protein 4 n=1 Tax=Staphylotrichum longicolle TaxID=669026 RepID=A0AAD4ES14_9PEZI|nr:carnitine transporter [Staphylotrichum longicolle]
MASNDLRDVLNLPSDQSAAHRPSKKQKTAAPRPNLKGLAREVQNLGGDNPIAIVPEVHVFKKRRFASRKPAARWELRAFTNSARDDGGTLVLRHWKRKTEHGAPPEPMQDGEMRPSEDGVDGEKKVETTEDSSFAKFNVQVSVPQYDDDQYRSNLQSVEWTKEETDYLMEVARDFDLRWPIIWDRYEFAPKPPPGEEANGTSTAVVPAPKPRTMEDLKARYYEVAAKMMAVQKPAQYMTRPEFELYEMMQNFNPEQERKRKEFALNTMARSKDEAREEESLLLEIKRILARTERFNEERRELYNRLDYPATDSDINSFKSSAGLQALLQNLMSTDKSKKRKSILGPGDGVSPSGAVPGSAASESNPNRRESIAAAPSSRRDSDVRGPAASAEPTPTTATSASGAAAAAAAAASAAAANKKKGSAAQPERRKLSTQEEQVYGITYHDRLGSGPTFRYERINKLYSHKSGQQQLRMTNALAELDVPPRLVMPTAAVTAQFEVLWSAVAALVDMRKLSDKLEGEIKLEEAKKVERERAKGVLGGDEAGKAGEGEEGKKGKEATEEATGEGGQAAAAEAKADGIKEEPGAEKDKTAAPDAAAAARPGSSGAHKRSASVLSTTSDKSAKRQKK